MNPIRCLAISNSYPPDHAGGYELGACNILESLERHYGWNNTVLSGTRQVKSPKTAELELTGFFPGKLGPEIELWRTKRSVLRNSQSIIAQIKERASKADLVFVFNPRRLIYPQWSSILQTETPAFVFVSDHWPNEPLASDIFHARSRKRADGRLSHGALRSIYSAATPASEILAQFRGVMFGSHFLKEKQVEAFSSNADQCVAHWGIDVGQFPTIAFSQERLKVFGFCGRPEKEKGLDLALDCIRDLVVEGHDVRLLVASNLQGSAYGRGIAKQIQTDPILARHVDLLGAVPHEELHERFYSQVGTLLFPSIWEEPFALTVLEAMSSGALVVASNTGGTPEVVDKSTGYLFDPQAKGDLSRVCRIVLATEWDQIRERVGAGIKRIRELHTIESMAKSVDTFVRELL